MQKETQLSTSQSIRQAIYFALLVCGVAAGVIGQSYTEISLLKTLSVFLLASIALISVLGTISRLTDGLLKLSLFVQVVFCAAIALAMGGVLGSLIHGL